MKKLKKFIKNHFPKLAALLGIAIVTLTMIPISVSAADDDSIIGTWVLNDSLNLTDAYINYSNSVFDIDVYGVIDENGTIGLIEDVQRMYLNVYSTAFELISSDVMPYTHNVYYANGNVSSSYIVSSTETFPSTYDHTNTQLRILVINSYSGGDDFPTWLFANGIKVADQLDCSTLPELLASYTGSFDSIVDMLNPTNYDEYESFLNDSIDNAYNRGVSASFGENLLGSTFDVPLNALHEWVLFETPDGIEVTMGALFTAVIALSVLVIFLKMFAGG